MTDLDPEMNVVIPAAYCLFYSLSTHNALCRDQKYHARCVLAVNLFASLKNMSLCRFCYQQTIHDMSVNVRTIFGI